MKVFRLIYIVLFKHTYKTGYYDPRMANIACYFSFYLPGFLIFVSILNLFRKLEPALNNEIIYYSSLPVYLLINLLLTKYIKSNIKKVYGILSIAEIPNIKFSNNKTIFYAFLYGQIFILSMLLFFKTV